MASKPDKTITKQSYRADSTVLHNIQVDIKKMLINLNTSKEICKFIQAKYSKSYSVSRGYLRIAMDDHKQAVSSDIDTVRATMQIHLLDQYRKNLKLADDTDKKHYGLLAIQYLDRYIKLYPNSLEPIVEEQQGNINITFNKVDP